MSRLREERQVLFLYFLTDAVLYWVALSVATVSRGETLSQIDFVMIHRDRLVCLLLFGAASFLAGVYKPHRITDRFDSIYYTLIALVSTGVAQLVLTSLISADHREIARREIVLALAISAPLLAAWHYFAASLVNRFKSLHRYFYVLGSQDQAQHIIEEISQYRSPMRAEARYINLETLRDRFEKRKRLLGRDHVATEDAIIALDPKDHWQLDEMLVFCKENCRRTFLYPSLHDVLLFQHHNLAAIAGVPLIEVASQQLTTPYLYLKRCIDFAAALAGLIFASPIGLVTAMLIKATSRGGALYAQERLGKNGRPFRIYKFRSMVSEVELKDETGHVLAQDDDPRITRVGRFIRKHRIDEIPQLFNVLRGDMSLIGPRPAWREFYETNGQRIPMLEQRLAVRPGLTCLSHVLGSYSSKPEDRLSYDLAYINTLSLMTDLRILIATVRIVLSGKGAR